MGYRPVTHPLVSLWVVDKMNHPAGFFGLGSPEPVRDDQILPITRWVGILLAPALLVASVILFIFPERTTQLFAWTIRPDMTPIVMGAGYGTGTYFFYRVARGKNWHKVALVFPGIAVFTWFMAAATALHWENFNHSHVTFVIWTFLYAIAPLLVPTIWYLNQRTVHQNPNQADRFLPNIVKWLAGISGTLMLLMAVVLFFVPDILITSWAWEVSPLTARILLGWFALFGAVNLAVVVDSRWSATRLLVQTKLLGFGLILLGVIRAWHDFDTTNPVTWGFIGGFVLYLIAIGGVYCYMEWY